MVLISYCNKDAKKAQLILFELRMRGINVNTFPLSKVKDQSISAPLPLRVSHLICLFSGPTIIESYTRNNIISNILNKRTDSTETTGIIPVSLDGSMPEDLVFARLMVLNLSQNWDYKLEFLITSLNIKARIIKPRLDLIGTRWLAQYTPSRYTTNRIIYDFGAEGKLSYSNNDRENRFRSHKHDVERNINGYELENTPFANDGKWALYGDRLFLKEGNFRFFQGRIKKGIITGVLKSFIIDRENKISFKYAPGAKFSDFWGE